MARAKTGRNDPCPCGSGKKYKRCCLDKDKAARHGPPTRPVAPPEGTLPPQASAPPQRARLDPRPPPPPREISPEERWWDDFFDRLEAAESVDERLSLARRALAEGPSFDGDLLELFDPVLVSLEQAGRHGDRVALLEAMEARFPEAAREQTAHFAHMRFESALEMSGVDLIAEARRFGPHVGEVSDVVTDLPARLAWEGKVPALRALTGAAWPAIRDERELFDWAIDQWAALGLSALLLDHLERSPDLDPEDPALLDDLAPFEQGEEEPGAVRAFVRRWLPVLEPRGDLPVEPSIVARLGSKDDVAASEQVTRLAARVASRLRDRKGWSRSQAWVLLREMRPLLADCAEKRREKGKRSPATLVLPPPSTLIDGLLRRNVGMFSRDFHTIAAVVFALPAWAGEAAARGWVSEKQAGDWLRECMGTLQASIEETPESAREELSRSLLAFAAGEGREVMRC